MFGIGSGEVILILIIVFLLFGPDRLPEVAKTIGKFVHDLKNASDDVKSAVMKDARSTFEPLSEEDEKTVAEETPPPPSKPDDPKA